MQKDLLEKYPDADVRVYAVWFDMVPTDSRSEWPAELLTDRRVTHRWDEKKEAGHWYAARFPSIERRLTPESKWRGDGVLWDAYLLYDANASWDEEQSGLRLFGRTIVAARESLAGEFIRLFAPASK